MVEAAVAGVGTAAAVGATATVAVRRAPAEATAGAWRAAMVGQKPVVMAAAVIRAGRTPGLNMPAHRMDLPHVGIRVVPVMPLLPVHSGR